MPNALENARRQPRYELIPGSIAEFAIHDYARAKAFASFLPGIAGPLGIPLWCYYVNRGQAVSAFGVQDKDGAILEFEPANKAYAQTPLTGFRSFLRLGLQAAFYEPFQEDQAGQAPGRRTRMVVSPAELRLEEEHPALGLKVQVRYFTLPQRPLAALCREVTLERIAPGAVDVDWLDGLPRVAPYGLGDLPRKTMGRTMEAWSHAEGLDEGLPYLRQRASSEDKVEVDAVQEGHFFCGWSPAWGPATPLVDPASIFGPDGGLAFPTAFAAGGFTPGAQRVENRSPCAFLRLQGWLEPGRPVRLLSVYGRAASLAEARACAQELRQPGSFDAWAAENQACVLEAAAPGWIASASPALDGYALQGFLDNVLRGGLAWPLQDGARRAVIHLYSRKHGDLERDYNAFSLMPSPYSQGNGAFRDICQNRRRDAWALPEAGDQSLRSFANLLQLDGHNPLVFQGLDYAWAGGEEGAQRLRELLPPADATALLNRLQKPCTPQDLHRFCRERGLASPGLLGALVAAVLTRSEAMERAAPEHGYWADHGYYLTDLLRSHEALYPDRLAALLQDPGFTYYDNPLVVQPRAAKLRRTPQGWRQRDAVAPDAEKAALIAGRASQAHRARSDHGRGPVFRASLWAKLTCFAANKLAGLDPRGVGLELDAEKPGWNDATNGLPGLFGSSTNESMALLRLLRCLRRWLAAAPVAVELHGELDAFLRGLAAAPQDPWAFWQAAGCLKEDYRRLTRLGMDGRQVAWGPAELEGFLAQAQRRLEAGLALARRPDGLMHTYFIHQPQVEAGPQGALTVLGFSAQDLPLFLEAQVHALRLCAPAEAAELARAVEASPLYDAALGMFKVNEPLGAAPMELGRLKAFTPGWLENESVFMHMQLKYLLELARQGLWDDLYRHFFRALPPFQDPARYGRSVFENSSFIASSANPDPGVHGQGFVARLSGSTVEAYDLLLTLALGAQPFRLGPNGLLFEPQPRLHGSLFLPGARLVRPPGWEAADALALPAGAFALRCFGRCAVVIHGQAGRHAYGPHGLAVTGLRLHGGGAVLERGPSLADDEARRLRAGAYTRLDILLG